MAPVSLASVYQVQVHCMTLHFERYVLHIPVRGQNKVAISLTSNHFRVIVVYQDSLRTVHNSLHFIVMLLFTSMPLKPASI